MSDVAMLVQLSTACHAAKPVHRLLLLALIAAAVSKSEQLSVYSRQTFSLHLSTLSRQPQMPLVPLHMHRSTPAVLVDGAEVGSRASGDTVQSSNEPKEPQEPQFTSRLEGMDDLARSWAEDLGLSSVEELEQWVAAFEAPDSDEVEYKRGVKRETKQQAARRARKNRRHEDTSS